MGKIEVKEKNHDRKESLLDGVPTHAPALLQAEKLQKKAAKAGFDWQDQKDILSKIREEADELQEAMQNAGRDEEAEKRIDEELGDLLFACANLSRFRKRRSAEQLLAASSAKFKRRFQYIEKTLASQNRNFEECSLEDLDRIWEEAKKLEKE